jgi:predicted metalloprotease
MQWEGRAESENVEDQRAYGPKTVALGSAGILVVLLGLVFGFDPQQLMQFVGQFQGQNAPQGNQGQPGRPIDPVEEKLAHFSKVIFHDTEEVWTDLFSKMGRSYQKPVLVLFSGQVDSACGQADSAVGPFYCGGDSKVYIDLAFYQDMQRKLNAPGEFARAYVIAHEVGHHVQRLLGYAQRAQESRVQGNKAQGNRTSVRLELQADYLAGVWAYHGQKRFNFLDPGDIDSALNAAFEIGDDRLQKKARGYVVPDAFTHGTSRQRQRWFMQGFQTGDVGAARQLFDLPYEDL